MLNKKLLTTFCLVAAMLLPQGAWAYESQSVYSADGSSAAGWTTLSGSKGLERKSGETQWDGTSGYAYTLYNGSAHYQLNMPSTLTYSESYTVSFFVNAKYGAQFQYALYKKGVTPTSSILGADDAVFSLTGTNTSGKTEDVGTDMTVSVNRSETNLTLKSKTYYKVVVTVNSTNTTYNIYSVNATGDTPYSLNATPVATGTLTSAEIGGLYMNAASTQTMRTDDISVSFMPNAKTVKTITATNTTTTNGLNQSNSKYYEKYTITATDYADVAIDNSNLTIAQTSDTYSTLSSNLLSFKGIGTTTVTVNNKSIDIENTKAYLKAASFDFTNKDIFISNSDASLSKNNAALNGFTSSAIDRYAYSKSGSKYILNSFKHQGYDYVYPNYGFNTNTGGNPIVAKNSANVSGMYLCLAYKKNTTGDATTEYASTETTYAWTQSDRTINLEHRDNKVVYTGLDVYIPDGTTVTPTLDGTYNITTFSYPYALDLSGLTTMTAWRATTATNIAITLEQVIGVVPAGTPLILRGTAEAIPVATEPGTSLTNSLKPVLDADTNKEVAAGTDGTTNYVLTVQNSKVVFAPIGGTSATVAYGKAYLNATPAYEARALSLDFGDGETTGIANVDVNANGNFDANAPIYNMAGQRVGKNYKGIVIVNGKKVIIK